MVTSFISDGLLAIAAADICKKFGGSEVRGGWSARCPTHDDKNPSLSISVKDRHLLVHCHAGCRQETVIAELRRCNLWPDLSPAALAFRAPETGLTHRIEETYIYRDENGQALHAVERMMNGTGFVQRRFENGQLMPKLGSVKPVLYRLNHLVAADPAAAVFLVEGEKDADRLADLGVVVTTNAMGATSWEDRYTEYFRNRDVVILHDNDEPGRRGANRKAKAIAAVAKSVRVHNFPDLERGGDISDWLDRCHGDVGDLYRLAQSLPLWQDPNRPHLKIVCMKDVERREVKWHWNPYIPRGKITLLDGDPGIGKSVLSLAIASALSRGDPLPGDPRQDAQKEDILQLAGEDSADDTIGPRLDALKADMGRIHIVEGVVTPAGESSLMLSAEGLSMIEEASRARKLGMIIIDPLLSYLGGEVDMYRANQVRAMMDPLIRLARVHDVAIVCIRHLVKSATNRAIHRGLGSIDFTASARSVLVVAKDPDVAQRSILAPAKSSLAAMGRGQAFIFDGEFRWDGEVSISADDALNAAQEGPDGRRSEAREFLRSVLKDEPIRGGDVVRLAEEAGISQRTLARAKAELGIVSEPGPAVDGKVRWVWKLASAVQENAE